MASNREDGPVYYREIQKNAYLKRIPNEVTSSKLRPLSKQKVPLKAMWTQFCIHNGRTPYLEQYPDADSPATLCHAPIWRACLKTARHVTASVKPHIGEQYDFLVDTDNGAVRMLAPDWESMQDWVTTLRNALHELKITGKGENVYCSAPAPPPAPRAPARDPTSPLPPTPPVPLDRVPGIELTPVRTQNQPETNRNNDTNRQTDTTVRQQDPTSRSNDPTIRQPDSTNRLLETTSRNTETTSRPTETSHRLTEPTTRLLEPTVRPQETSSRLLETNSRNTDSTVSNQDTIENGIENIDISNWDEPFSSLPSTSQFKSDKNCSVTKICGQNICLDDSLFKRPSVDSDDEFFAELDKIDDDAEFKQRVVVSSDEKIDSAGNSNTHPISNVTVIQVSNKEPPHTAIPVMGTEVDVFDFEFKQKFINIVNTEENQYGTTFGNESEYGHISLTTTVNLSGESNRPTFESNRPSLESNRPILESNRRTFETEISNSNQSIPKSEDIYERLCLASTSKPSPLPVKNMQNTENSQKSSLANLEVGDSTYEYLFLGNINGTSGTTNNTTDVRNNTVEVRNSTVEVRNNTSEVRSNTRNVLNNMPNTKNTTNSADVRNNTSGVRNNTSQGRNNTTEGRNDTTQGRNSTEVNCNTQISRSNTVQVNTRPNDPISRLRAVERSRSQNEYDVSSRRTQNNSPKMEIKNETTEPPQSKPMWKRGLTELSLLSLSRLRSSRQNKKRDSPTRNGTDNDRPPNITSPKVLHRSRNENRVDSTRRRSSSLSNGQSPPFPTLTPLRAQQAATLIAEQRRGAALVATIPVRDPPVFADYENQVWVSSWGGSGGRVSGRVGDRVAALRRRTPATAGHARSLLQGVRTVDILFHRVPLGKIYVVSKRDQENLGIKLDSECNIISVESGSPAARAGLPLPGAWAITEVNNRPINLVKGGEEEMHRLSRHGTEVSLLLQPSPFVKQLRNSLKGNKSLLGLR